MELLSNPEIWVAFLTLALLEIVLGIDNIIFISILTTRLPENQQPRARFIGLSAAMIMRILLLLSLSWIMGLTADLFVVFGEGISGRDLILLIGGAFLIAKSAREVVHALEIPDEVENVAAVAASFSGVLVQIALIDIVFSLDSVITAVGLVDEIPVMIAAIVVAVGIMMVAAQPVSEFIDRYPSIKMLALSFLTLIGFALVAEGLDIIVPKGYIYASMAFAFAVQLLNIRASKKPSVRIRKAKWGDLIAGADQDR